MRVRVRTESTHGDDEPIVLDDDGIWETIEPDGKCIAQGGLNADPADGMSRSGIEEHISYGTTAMTVREDEIIIDGAGELRSHIVLRSDGRIYETAFESADIGTLVMGIRTHHLVTRRSGDGLVIEIGYDLMHQGMLVNEVGIVITVSKEEV